MKTLYFYPKFKYICYFDKNINAYIHLLVKLLFIFHNDFYIKILINYEMYYTFKNVLLSKHRHFYYYTKQCFASLIFESTNVIVIINHQQYINYLSNI